jgi:hypothetical protein
MPPDVPPELSAGLDLPAFTDRLPDLVQALRATSRDLAACGPHQSYVPYWEDVYAIAHSLKGVMHILSCPPVLADFMVRFNAALVEGLSGPAVCRQLKAAGDAFTKLADALDRDPLPGEDFNGAWLASFRALYTPDVDHEARMAGVPAHLFYVNEQVSKKAREITLLGLNHCVVEDHILLDEIPLWRTQLSEALVHPEFGRGLVVNFLPFISSEGSQTLKVWAWVAAATHSRAALKSRVKEVMPKVTLTKL